MKSDTKCPRPRRQGSALVLSLLFIAIFSTLAAALANLSGANVQIAKNQRKGNLALASAESGLEVIQYWLMRTRIPGSTAPEDILSTVLGSLTTDLTTQGVTNVTTTYDGSAIRIPSVSIGSPTGQTFDAVIRQFDDTTLQIDITGHSGDMARTIRVNYPLVSRPHPIFDYGWATQGPVQLPGNPTSAGVTALGDADMYIVSESSLLALSVSGNTNLDGNITIWNPDAYVFFDSAVQIAGETGQAAIDNHIEILEPGAPQVEFPYPDTDHFRSYATGTFINSATDTSTMTTLTNVRIAAGANKVFNKNVTINGVLFIEAPNTVEFKGNVQIRGIVIGDGDAANPGGNSVTVGGNLYATSFPADAAYDGMRHETGASFLAPGFAFELPGNFCSLSGVMAVSGLHISGNVDATINGTIINYSDTPMVIEGNPTFRFDRSACVETPAGFASILVPVRDPFSYQEMCL